MDIYNVRRPIETIEEAGSMRCRYLPSDIYPVDTKELHLTGIFINVYPKRENKGHIICGHIQCSTTTHNTTYNPHRIRYQTLLLFSMQPKRV